MLAEAAWEDGFRPIALDLFGDDDTRRAAEDWWPIGEPGRRAVDEGAFLAALSRAAEGGEAAGWIAGSGFEGRPELLAVGGRILPLLGNPAEVVDRIRAPADFFAMLARLGVPHPETRIGPPPQLAGWLLKDAAGSGGWHIRAAGSGRPAGARPYYQRIASGEPMSALFLAAGGRGRIVGVSRQIVRPLGGRPCIFRGCLGPVPLPPTAAAELGRIVDALAAEAGLRGLNGLDFLLDGEGIAVLELNPRPSASMGLYGPGLMKAHLAAVLEGRLPTTEAAAPDYRVRGFEVVFARRDCQVGDRSAAALGRIAWCHDRPAAGVRAGWGEPLCTVSAEADTPAEVQALLLQRRREIRSLLEQENG